MNGIKDQTRVAGNGHKMRVGIIHYTLPPAISGVEMVIRDHARLLSSHGFRIFLLGASGKKFRSEIEVKLARSFDPKNKIVLGVQEELKRKIVSKRFEALREKYIKILKRWISTNKLEIVIMHNILSRHYNLALTAAIVEVAQELSEVKFISWVHDASFVDTFYTQVKQPLKEIYPWNLIATYQRPFTYVTVSNTRKSELKGLYGKDKKIIVIPNGLDINKMLPLPLQTRMLFKEILARHGDYTGLIPVRIVERKNIEFAVEFAKVARDTFGKNIIFIITGALHLQNAESTEYYDYIKSLIKKEGVERNFFFLYNYRLENGEKFNIYNLNIRDLYLISDFLFLPSKSEGFGLPIIEAGFMRIPIFTSLLPVFKEVGNGYINTFDLKTPIQNTVKSTLTYLKRSRSTLFHKLILNEYSLETTVMNKIIPLLNSL